MEVVLKSDFIYQQIFINWWIEQKYFTEYNDELKRSFDEYYLGIQYNIDSWYYKNWDHKRKVINEQKFFLAKIKHGL